MIKLKYRYIAFIISICIKKYQLNILMLNAVYVKCNVNNAHRTMLIKWTIEERPHNYRPVWPIDGTLIVYRSDANCNFIYKLWRKQSEINFVYYIILILNSITA